MSDKFMDKILSNILRVIEFSIKNKEEKCLKYAGLIYDKLENPDITRDDFLKMCNGYFHPEETGWAIQDNSEETTDNYNDTLEQEIVNVKMQPTEDQLQHQETFVSLFKSFSENFDNGQQDIGEFMPMFKTMAGPLSQLTIKDAFVDVNRKKGMIDFNLYLEKGIFLSVAKCIAEMSDDVMFTIARNHKTLVIGEMPLSELMHNVSEIVMEL